MPDAATQLTELGERYFRTQHTYDPYNATLLGITEFDALAELTAQCGDDRLAEMALDFVLHKARRDRKQRKALGDDERFDQL